MFRSNKGSALTRKIKTALGMATITVKSSGFVKTTPCAVISGEVENLMSARSVLAATFDCSSIMTYCWGSQFYVTPR